MKAADAIKAFKRPLRFYSDGVIRKIALQEGSGACESDAPKLIFALESYIGGCVNGCLDRASPADWPDHSHQARLLQQEYDSLIQNQKADGHEPLSSIRTLAHEVRVSYPISPMIILQVAAVYHDGRWQLTRAIGNDQKNYLRTLCLEIPIPLLARFDNQAIRAVQEMRIQVSRDIATQESLARDKPHCSLVPDGMLREKITSLLATGARCDTRQATVGCLELIWRKLVAIKQEQFEFSEILSWRDAEAVLCESRWRSDQSQRMMRLLIKVAEYRRTDAPNDIPVVREIRTSLRRLILQLKPQSPRIS